MPYTGPEPARRPLSSDDITDGIISTADLADSAVTTAKITNNAVTAAKVSSDVSQLGKNLIQNGSMAVAQRGATITSPTNAITLDRWHAQVSGAAAITVSQDTGVAGSGFAYRLKVDCTTADASIAASDRVHIRQVIEAQNLQHLKYGDASAKTITLSFRVSSPKSGTHCVALYQADGARSYIREYTVTSADTEELITVTFPGDPSGTINNDNGEGLYVTFPLIAGTDYQAAADGWAAGFDFATSNQQNLLDDTANNFYITGVQLEIGSVATDFEHEDYGTTLAKCHRYFWRWKVQSNASQLFAITSHNSSTNCIFQVSPPQPFRAQPSTAVSDMAHILVADGANVNKTFTGQAGYRGADGTIVIQLTGGTGLTTGAGYAYRDASDALYWDFDAEL